MARQAESEQASRRGRLAWLAGARPPACGSACTSPSSIVISAKTSSSRTPASLGRSPRCRMPPASDTCPQCELEAGCTQRLPPVRALLPAAQSMHTARAALTGQRAQHAPCCRLPSPCTARAALTTQRARRARRRRGGAPGPRTCARRSRLLLGSPARGPASCRDVNAGVELTRHEERAVGGAFTASRSRRSAGAHTSASAAAAQIHSGRLAAARLPSSCTSQRQSAEPAKSQ